MEENKKQFIEVMRNIAPEKHRYDVFRDFVTMSAISLHNAICKEDVLEDEYLKIIATYNKKDQKEFPKLLGLLVELLEPSPKDVLGELYMEMEIASKNKGQFFTPVPISEFMSQILGAGDVEIMDKPFIKLSEPACGAGGMVLAWVKQMIASGHNPSKKLWVHCIDIDRLCALMCYVQLTLWNVPGVVIVGDTLSGEIRETWYTPAHYIGNWDYKLSHEQGESETLEKETQAKQEIIDPEGEQQAASKEVYALNWKGVDITIEWLENFTSFTEHGHLQIWSANNLPLPITETGYKSHFIDKQDVEEKGGPVAYVKAWLEECDDGKSVQYSLF